MTISAYSPGPWLYEYSPYTSQDGDEIPAFEIHSADCKVAHTNEDRPREEQEANARLLAAAPELFAALEYFFNIMHDYPSSMRKGYVKHALDLARTALVSAKGRPDMSIHRFIEIDGKRHLWRDIQLRREQMRSHPQAQEPAMFELKENYRPAAERTAAGRYSEPTLFSQ